MILKLALITVTCLIAMTGILFLRKVKFPALDNLSVDAAITFFTQSLLWTGVLLSGIAFLFYVWVLSKYETSSVMPIFMGINLVILSVFSVLFFGESITLMKISAYCLIFGGMWLLS